MPQDFQQTTTTTTKADYRVAQVAPDSPRNQDETNWDNPDFVKWFSNYKKHAKIKKAIDGFADWVLGLGYVTDARTQAILEHISGNKKEGFNDLLWNGIVIKKINGESYTHIIRDPDDKQEGIVINMRALNPQYMRVVYDRKGRIKEYRYYEASNKSGSYTPFQTNEILHLLNDKVVDETHGVSVCEAVEWNISAQEEAKRVHRKLVWRSGVVRVIEVDTSNPTELATLKAQYKIAEEKGDVLLLPKDKAKAVDWKPNMDVAGIISWLSYLDDEFYISIGFPRDLAGASSNATEASMKMAYVTHHPLYEKEVKELEDALWNQQSLKITFNRQPSLMDNVQSDETKNTGQTSMKPIGSGQ